MLKKLQSIVDKLFRYLLLTINFVRQMKLNEIGIHIYI